MLWCGMLCYNIIEAQCKMGIFSRLTYFKTHENDEKQLYTQKKREKRSL